MPLVGASGSIAAVLGAYFVLFPRARVLSLVFLVVFFQLVEVPAVYLLGLWIVLQLIDVLTALGRDTTVDGVAIFAHVGRFRGRASASGSADRRLRPRPVGAALIGSRRRGIIGPWPTSSSRWWSRASGSTCRRASTW